MSYARHKSHNHAVADPLGYNKDVDGLRRVSSRRIYVLARERACVYALHIHHALVDGSALAIRTYAHHGVDGFLEFASAAMFVHMD